MNSDETSLLRPLDFQPVVYQGQPMWFLRDPLHLSERQLFLPQEMAPLLTLLDGNRTRQEIHDDFCALAGLSLDQSITEDALRQLDEACLLDNARSAEAYRRRLAAYRNRPFRAPTLAGSGYPAEARALADYLAGFDNGLQYPSWTGRGVVSPHIDYDRGGQVYAQVWRQAEAAVLAADLVIILGTDHYGGLGTITLTRQPYATPYGVLPPATDLTRRLALSVGEEQAFADELHHQFEHSVELSAVWLHHIFHQAGRQPCPMLPVLIGSFQHFLVKGGSPGADERFARFLHTLREQTESRRVLTVASVDLAHVGPNFGDTFVMDSSRRADLAQEDQLLIAAALKGDAEGWYARIAAVRDRNRICGFSPTYLMLRHLGRTVGRQVAYEQCSADHQDTSLVSICGLLLE